MKPASIIIACYALVYSCCVFFGKEMENEPDFGASDGADWIVVSPAPGRSCYQEPQKDFTVQCDAEFTLVRADRQSRAPFPAEVCAKRPTISPPAAVE